MLLQLLLVLGTFAVGSVGGLVFSGYYFATSGMGNTVRTLLQFPLPVFTHVCPSTRSYNFMYV